MFLSKISIPTAHAIALSEFHRFDVCDLGYVTHASLTETLDGVAPSPYRFDEKEGQLLCLGYSREPAEQMRRVLQERASIEHLRTICRSMQVETKPMPSDWKKGQQFLFSVRVSPTVQPGKGSDVDAFLNATRTRPTAGLTREGVYRDWLRIELASYDVTMGNSEMSRFTLREFWRREHRKTTEKRGDVIRKGTRFIRPDVTFDGLLTVGDPEKFETMLARGIGRHRGFGFGMVLLRRAG